jgi:sialate O-acetylesterase
MKSFSRFCLFLLLLPIQPLWADLRLPQIFSDHMVLQRDLPVHIWGWASPGDTVTVEFGGQKKEASAAADGKWMLNLDPLPANSVPQEMGVRSRNGQSLAIKDVLVGEVWFSAGQSNMMMGLASATGGESYYEQYAKEGIKNIRVVNQAGPHLTQSEVKDDVSAVWGAPTKGYSAVSFFFAHKLYQHFKGQIPVGMITYTAIAPAEAWIDRATLEKDPRLSPVLNDPLQLATKNYNGVIAPIAPYSIRGILYYQAEYNGFGERGLQFRTMMPTLIEVWRRQWRRPDLPFLFVQLPGFVATEAPTTSIDMDPATLAAYKLSTERKTWTEVRESQLLTWLSVPQTGMAITIDLGESYDIHPPNKGPVADRLLLQARRVAYGEDILASGPVPKEVVAEKGGFLVSFTDTGLGLRARGSELKGFEIAGRDLKFVPAVGEIKGGRVFVHAESVKDPVHLRYAWDGNPEATLANSDDLPATPFRYSDWSNSPQAGSSSFKFPNPSFEETDKKGSPTWWIPGPGMTLNEQRASDGKQSIALPIDPKSLLQIKGLALGTGVYWNSAPLTDAALRPGCLVGYSADLAVMESGKEGNLFMNLCQDASGGGYQAWGGIRNAKTRSAEFVTRKVVQRMSDTALETIVNSPSNAGARFLNQSSSPETVVLLDNLSAVSILRPLFEISSSNPIDLGTVAPGTAKESEKISIRNGQKEQWTQVLTDEDPGEKFSTILYGTASFEPDGKQLQQKIAVPTDHVGAILTGKDAALFEFVSAHSTPQQLKLVGEDGKGGLGGGPTPETETFSLRFCGAEKPGIYQAKLRIVTQAGNQGVLSQAGPGEPPGNLYYLDIPVQVNVK